MVYLYTFNFLLKLQAQIGLLIGRSLEIPSLGALMLTSFSNIYIFIYFSYISLSLCIMAVPSGQTVLLDLVYSKYHDWAGLSICLKSTFLLSCVSVQVKVMF